jgi:23S rRNA pseudouridine2605 synthase
MLKPIRIAKIIAQSGKCSRREAEALITEGRVQVNGVIISSPATFITDESIKIDGKLLNSPQPTRLFLFYKPVGCICTHQDPENRTTLFSLLPKNLPRLVSVGRLDFNTEGLILLTTNGSLARFFELPKNKLIRTYKVRVFGNVDDKKIKRLERGITVENVRYKPMTVSIDSQSISNSWLTVNLSEGKNREIRKIMLHIGLQVSRLIRISYGNFNLGSMKPLDIIEVAKKNIPKITNVV